MKNFKLKSKSSCYVLIAFVIFLLNLNANARTQNFTYIYRDYLRNMINMMDSKLQPCDDFFQHACGNFNQFHHHLGSVTEDTTERNQIITDHDIVPFLYNNQDRYMFFKTHKKYFGTIPGRLVRNVYDLCKGTLKPNNSKRKLWLKMIKEVPFLKHDYNILSKWPFLEYQWEKYEEQLNLIWPVLAAELSAHGLNTFIKVFFAENTIYVEPNENLSCLESENDVRTSILPLLRQRNAQIADIIGSEIWILCRQLKGEISFSGEITNSTNFLANNAIMDKFFQHLFPRLNIVEPEVEYARKVFIHIDELAEIISLLGLTNPRVVYNFIIWQAYQQITSIDDCFNLIHEFDTLLEVEYWNWHAFNQHFRREVALALYLFHTTRFQKHYRNFITSTSVERLFQNRSERKDLNIERIIKNYAKQYLNRETYSDVYESALFSREPSTFYSLLFEFRRLKLRYTFLHPTADHLEEPNFFKEFINFSILLLYRPRLHYFATYDRHFWENSKILQSSDGFYAAEDCLERQTTLNSDDSKLYENLTENQVDEIFNFYTAFTEARSDYRFWLESENFAIAEDFILEYFKLNSTRVLFYAVAQQYCSRNDFLYKHLINRSYMNMPDFQTAFNCQPIDEMNPVTKCMVNQWQ